MALDLKSTILCARTLEIITLVDSDTLDDLEQLQIQQDKSACRALLRQPWSAVKEVCDRWIKIFCGDRFIGAMGIETANSHLVRLHFFLIGKNKQVARAVVTGVILHEQFKGNVCSTQVPSEPAYEYMKNFLLNSDCAITASTEQATFFEASKFMNPSKFIRSFFTVPFPIPSTTTQEE
jgi:hypothetical protein